MRAVIAKERPKNHDLSNWLQFEAVILLIARPLVAKRRGNNNDNDNNNDNKINKKEIKKIMIIIIAK